VALQELHLFAELLILFPNMSQVHIAVPQVGDASIGKGKDLEGNTKDLSERPAEELQQPLTLAGKQEERG
jgi:hypothetical protein